MKLFHDNMSRKSIPHNAGQFLPHDIYELFKSGDT